MHKGTSQAHEVHQGQDGGTLELDLYSFGTPLRDAAAVARAVEAAEFGGLWFAEVAHNPFLPSAISALATESITIGTAVALAFPRSPMVAAQAAWDLAAASDGRFVLGLGTQVKSHMERRFSVPFSHPGPRLREYVLALRHIFAAFQDESRLDFTGEYYAFSLLPPFFSPGPIQHPDIPIYVAGFNARMARVAGEVADGLHVHPLHSARYLHEVIAPEVAAGAASAVRSTSEVALVVPVFLVVGDLEEDIEQQREAMRSRIAFYGSTRTYRAVFALHGWDDVPDRLHALQARGEGDAMAAVINDEMLDTFSVTARWDELAAALRARYGGLAARVMPYSMPIDWHDVETVDRWRNVAVELRAPAAGVTVGA
jgi:probable F420-dependent oxidoreductase